jgi:hypothetical protein
LRIHSPAPASFRVKAVGDRYYAQHRQAEPRQPLVAQRDSGTPQLGAQEAQVERDVVADHNPPAKVSEQFRNNLREGGRAQYVARADPMDVSTANDATGIQQCRPLVLDVAVRREQHDAHFDHTVVLIGVESGGLEIEDCSAEPDLVRKCQQNPADNQRLQLSPITNREPCQVTYVRLREIFEWLTTVVVRDYFRDLCTISGGVRREPHPCNSSPLWTKAGDSRRHRTAAHPASVPRVRAWPKSAMTGYRRLGGG